MPMSTHEYPKEIWYPAPFNKSFPILHPILEKWYLWTFVRLTNATCYMYWGGSIHMHGQKKWLECSRNTNFFWIVVSLLGHMNFLFRRIMKNCEEFYYCLPIIVVAFTYTFHKLLGWVINISISVYQLYSLKYIYILFKYIHPYLQCLVTTHQATFQYIIHTVPQVLMWKDF